MPVLSLFKPSPSQVFLTLIGLGAIAYTGTCLYLHATQRDYLYSPRREFWRTPNHPDFRLPYEEFYIPVNAQEKLHAWWISAPTAPLKDPLPGEPLQIVQDKTVLYFYGRGGNKGSGGLSRAAALHQLGFSVLMIDYRGFGASDGEQPSQSTMFEDSEIAWDYLVRDRNLSPRDIIIYGQSMGGAVAIHLAHQQPDALALIAQSTFTSMTEAVQLNPLLRLLPIHWILTDKFDSISKVPELKMPMLLIHGTADAVVPAWMSEQLYNAARVPKSLHWVPGAGHFQLYQPGSASYLKAIAQFLTQIPQGQPTQAVQPIPMGSL